MHWFNSIVNLVETGTLLGFDLTMANKYVFGTGAKGCAAVTSGLQDLAGAYNILSLYW
jgi:hypothetical protein